MSVHLISTRAIFLSLVSGSILIYSVFVDCLSIQNVCCVFCGKINVYTIFMMLLCMYVRVYILSWLHYSLESLLNKIVLAYYA